MSDGTVTFEAFGKTLSNYEELGAVLHQDVKFILTNQTAVQEPKGIIIPDANVVHWEYGRTFKPEFVQGPVVLSGLKFDDVNIAVNLENFVTLFHLFRQTTLGATLARPSTKELSDESTSKIPEYIKQVYFDIFERMFSQPAREDVAVYYLCILGDALYYIRRKACTEELPSDYFVNDYNGGPRHPVTSCGTMVVERFYPSICLDADKQTAC